MATIETLPFKAPVVDSLSIQVIVDSRYENYLPKETHAFARVEHIGDIPGKLMQTFAAEWGLSLHLIARSERIQSEYLLDFGWTSEIINRNFDLLDIDPTKLNGLVLSHGHLDHFGGMDGFLQRYRTEMSNDLPLYIGGEDVFAERWAEDPKNPGETDPELASWGKLDREKVLIHNVMPVCCHGPHVIENAFTSGYLDRASFEINSSHTLLQSVDHFTAEEREGKLVTDLHPEEHALCYLIRDRGLVVISSCGHAGIINTVKAAMAVAGTDKLHAVIGGFHLAAAKQDYIDFTLDQLDELGPDIVLPMHCTGPAFIEKMRTRMPEKLITANVGSRYTFSA